MRAFTTAERRRIGGGPLKSTKSVRKVKVYCEDGPLCGHALFLQEDRCTAIFTLLNQTGRYINGKWHAA